MNIIYMVKLYEVIASCININILLDIENKMTQKGEEEYW